MSEMLEVTRQDFPAGSNKIITTAGKVTIGRNESCSWYTAGGSISTVVITSKGKKTLSLQIYGAPESVKTSTGQVLNGSWTLYAKDQRVESHADFLGRTVTFFNYSAESTDCEIMAMTRT